MTTLVAFIIGVVWGAYLARSRGGDWKDSLHYAAGFGICFALVAIVISVFLLR